jgi:hypothetical protein
MFVRKTEIRLLYDYVFYVTDTFQEDEIGSVLTTSGMEFTQNFSWRV